MSPQHFLEICGSVTSWKAFPDATGVIVYEGAMHDGKTLYQMSVAQALADHAPQMAAAILRFFKAEEHCYGHDFNTPAQSDAYHKALCALRDSLPKDLRP